MGHIGGINRISLRGWSYDGLVQFGGNCVVNCNNGGGNLYGFIPGGPTSPCATGSVRFLKQTIAATTMHKLVSRVLQGETLDARMTCKPSGRPSTSGPLPDSRNFQVLLGRKDQTICQFIRESSIRPALPLILSVAGCSGHVDDGLEKYPVHGQVLVNQPARELMSVTLQQHRHQRPGQRARPVAVTDPEGRFALSTNADKDGAVPGEYLVTFFWASENGPSAYDRLGGRFSNPTKSDFRAASRRRRINSSR